MAQRVAAADIERVFDAWRVTRPRPALCRLTEDRRATIRARIRLGYTADDLIAVIEYLLQADEPDPRWMRGHNPGRRAYLDLENMLRRQRLGERVESAALWRERGALDADADVIPPRVLDE